MQQACSYLSDINSVIRLSSAKKGGSLQGEGDQKLTLHFLVSNDIFLLEVVSAQPLFFISVLFLFTLEVQNDFSIVI